MPTPESVLAAAVPDLSNVAQDEHVVQFYEHDDALVDKVGAVVGDALAEGASAIVIATPSHLAAFERCWASRGIDLASAKGSGRYVTRDAAATLASFLSDGWPDARRFTEAIEPLVASASKRHARVVIFGEMVALLWADGNHAAAVRLERLWNELALKYRFLLCCAYPLDAIAAGPQEALREVCAEHARALPAESYSALSTEAERLAAICQLQQRAEALERETTRRKSTESLLARREHELSEFLEGAPHAIHSVDANGVILWANRYELEMLGYSADEYIGRSIDDFYVDRNLARSLVRRLAEGETLREEAAQVRCKDGSVRDVLVTSNACWDGETFSRTRCFTRDVTLERRAEQALRESEARAESTRALLAAIVESSNDAVISKSLDGRITSWNDGAARLFGYRPDEAIGQPIMMIIPSELRHEEFEILERISRGERIEQFETTRVAKDGRRIDVSLTISPVRSDDGRIIGVSKVARDISERKRIEEALRISDRRKDEFIAMLGHELRNPLAPIRTAAEVFRRIAGGNPEYLELSQILQRQVQQMTRLLDDLLDVSRITQGKIKFKREAFDLALVAQRAVEACRPLMESRRHQLRLDLPKAVLRVEGDSVRLVQLVTNLLNNAARYTPVGGRITLTMGRRRGAVEIRVKDNGAGISPDALPRIFDLFVQANPSATGSQDGLGIGLTLVKIIAEHHGGTVTAASAGPGQGSEFIVTLPAAAQDTGLSVAIDPPASDAAAARRRIVIVDDNVDASQSLATLLRLSGHDVFVACDGPSALQTVRTARPDLIMLDIGLPGMSGYEVAKQLRDNGCKGRLVAVTGYGAPEDRQRSHDAGFDHHLVKPIEPSSLEQLIAGA